MKEKKKRDREHFLGLKDNRDYVDVRIIIIIALMVMLVMFIPALVIGGNHKRGAGAEAAKDTLAEEIVEESVGYVPGTAGNVTIDSRQRDMDTKEESDMPDLSERYIYFAGYEYCSVGAGERMALVNLPENEDIYIAYTVYLSDTGEEVFKTDLIAPGNSVEWTVSENLEPGEYRLSLYQAPYILDNHGDFMELICASNEMTIIVNY